MSSRPPLGPVDKNVDTINTTKNDITTSSTTTIKPPPPPSIIPEKRNIMTDCENENKVKIGPHQIASTPLNSRYKWNKGDLNLKGTENENVYRYPPPKFNSHPQGHSSATRTHPGPGSSPYPFYQHQQHTGAYPQPQPFPVSLPFPTPMGHHAHSHPHQRQPQTPYMYSPTPTLTYSPYDLAQRVPSVAGAGKKASTTPTPSSRVYRSTPVSVQTPFSSASQQHQPQTPASASGGRRTERILLPKPRGMPRPILNGLEPHAVWPPHEPPHLWLEGEDGKEVAMPENLSQSEAERWAKLTKDSNKFRSHNPWDYIPPDSRQQFSPSQRVTLETLWILTSTPCPKERERIAVWMGVSTSRITIFFQNRRQGIVKARNARNSSVPIWDGSPRRQSCDPHAWWADGPTRSPTLMASAENQQYFGMIKLNSDRGFVDDHGKWTAYDGDNIPLPPAEYMEKLPILHTIIRGDLDHTSFYSQYMASLSPRTSTSGSPPDTPLEYNSQMPNQFFEQMMLNREAAIPNPTYSKKRVLPEWDDEGNLRNLVALIPTDPPSESPVKLRARVSGSRPRGQRIPDFAMRATSPLDCARATGKSLYWTSHRAQALAANGTSSNPGLCRTQSLPSLSQQLDQRRPIPPPALHRTGSQRPTIATKPRRSFARSQSAADVGSPEPRPKVARLSEHDKSISSMSVVSEEEEEEELEEEDMTAAQALLGFSRASASASASTSSRPSAEREVGKNEEK